ncbi:MAG: hypothetical protein LKF71_04050, partial [Oscillospiraceae bacterium]|nr:hypothetical protein [Oscillospiraceae bacterium]
LLPCMDTEYFAQRIQCSRNDKQECLQTIYIMVELAFTTHGGGIHAMDEFLSKSRERNVGNFLMNAVQLYMDVKDVEQLRTVLYNSIICSNLSGPQFLNAVIITEVLAALLEEEDIDFIFSFLVPSFFGIDFENIARQAYQDYRRMVLLKHRNDPEQSEEAVD